MRVHGEQQWTKVAEFLLIKSGQEPEDSEMHPALALTMVE